MITNARKPIDRGTCITGSLIGTRRLFARAERARRLASIAHPDFREELQQAAHGIQERGL